MMSRLRAYAGELSALDLAFAAYLHRLDPLAGDGVLAAGCLAAHWVAQGHVCIDLEAFAGKRLWESAECVGLELPALDRWEEALRASRVVGQPGEYAPLILDSAHRLYLARYWRYERNLADQLRDKASVPVPGVSLARLRDVLDRLFGNNAQLPDGQKIAAAVAVLKGLCIISGGPGTGKTSTVLRILAALQMQAAAPLHIALAAPTGKAAMRLAQAIRAAKQRLELDPGILALIPEHASTLHRLLGTRPDGVTFRHDHANPLPVDVLVVDEASMIDLALMAKTLDALPKRARLILLGDKDQLASVEAGAVFGDLCEGGGLGGGAFRESLRQATGCVPTEGLQGESALAECVAMLQKSYRFTGESGIGNLARLANLGDVSGALDLLRGQRCPDLGWHEGTYEAVVGDLEQSLSQGYAGYFAAVRARALPQEVFARFNAFRVLCAHRRGRTGAEGINRLVEERVLGAPRLGQEGLWYPGRPIMIARNDYGLGLFNGDIGIALPTEQGLRVFFETVEGPLRSFPPVRLPEHATAYAMTVHKSQGSEFDEVALVLPADSSRVLTRELVYTGITRARRRVDIWGPEATFVAGLAQRTTRASGLRDRLRVLNPIP
ncbi:MAG: exodeoxyribonuclease V subunit alpha [Betaproteobacteria bacterium]|nr:exodeoxyribonuclease V subunit alpha [Betaproteobacteria bacterium]